MLLPLCLVRDLAGLTMLAKVVFLPLLRIKHRPLRLRGLLDGLGYVPMARDPLDFRMMLVPVLKLIRVLKSMFLPRRHLAQGKRAYE